MGGPLAPPALPREDTIQLDELDAESVPPAPPSLNFVAPRMPESIPPALSERPRGSRARAIIARLIFVVVLAASLAILVLAGRRFLQRRAKGAESEPVHAAKVVAETPASPKPHVDDLDGVVPATVPAATVPPAAPTPTVAPSTKARPSAAPAPRRTPTSKPAQRKPNRVVFLPH